MSANKLALAGIGALLLGAAMGIFLGPLAKTFLLPFANAFSMILQMAVFPYICLSIVLGVAVSSSRELLHLFKRAFPFAIFLWAMALFFVYFLSQIVPESYPPIYPADRIHKTKDALDLLLNYFSPENGLNALANNKIAAGLSFSLFFGAALKNIEKKEELIPYLEKSLQILERIFVWIRLISPLGVFLYIAIAFGTIDFEDLFKIRYYLLGRVFLCLVFSLVFIPLFFPSKRIYPAIGKSCLLPFLCGSAPLLIPFLVQYREESKEELILIPTAYCTLQVGSTIVLFLSTFLSFYYRFSVSFFEEILIYFLFAPVSFGEPTSLFSSSLFITHFNLPVTESQLDAETGLFIHHFLILMSATAILALILWVRAPHRLSWKKVTLFSLLFIATIYTVKPFIHMSDYYEGVYQNRKLSDVFEHPVQAKLLPIGEGGTARDATKSRLQQIIESGVLKVGIEEYVMPYSYFNDAHELVGYDIAYAYQLARDLDCSLEFILADVNNLSTQLDLGDFDLGMASFLMTENRLRHMEFTQPSFQQEDNVLIVPREKRGEFTHLESIQTRRLKLLTEGAYSDIARTYFPNAELVAAHGYTLLKNRQVDACFWTRTSGFVWCILNPEFVVIDYGSALGHSYLAYPIRENSFEFVSFLNNWLKVKEQSGFKEKMVRYWIKGEPAEKK